MTHSYTRSFARSILAALLGLALTAVFVLTLLPQSFAVSYDQVAKPTDMASVEEVGLDGLQPISFSDVNDGTYGVEVECSSSMFKIENADLTVANGKGTLTLTLSGTSYSFLYPGTAEDAAALNDPAKYIPFEKDADGKYTYKLPIANLDQPFPCAAFSKNKERWYDRTLMVRADTLPEGAVKVKLPNYAKLEQDTRERRVQEMRQNSGVSSKNAVKIDEFDGSYSIVVNMTGGSGRASITSPTTMTVLAGRAYATIQWDSPNYDYMIVAGEKIKPQNFEEDSNSSFLIPILKFDEPFKVIADTTAMSEPHEIEYELTFEQDTIKRYSNTMWILLVIGLILVIAFAFGVYKFWTSDFLRKK